MPLPLVKKGEKQDAYVARCMKVMGKEKRPAKQKLAICFQTFRNKKKK